MDFLSPDTNVSCVNITINDDSILESNESVELEMTSDYPVLLQRAFSTIVIMDDDSKHVILLSPYSFVVSIAKRKIMVGCDT